VIAKARVIPLIGQEGTELALSLIFLRLWRSLKVPTVPEEKFVEESIQIMTPSKQLCSKDALARTRRPSPEYVEFARGEPASPRTPP